MTIADSKMVASGASRREGMSLTPLWQAVIVIALIALVYWQTIRTVLVARWINDGNWSHGWLIPLFSVYFLYLQREQLQRIIARPILLGAVLLAFSLFAFFYFSWVRPFAYLQAITIVGTVFGALILLGGWPVVRVTWFPVFFLFLAIPLPQRQYFELTFPLRAWASTVSAAILPILIPGLHTEAQAVVIDYMAPSGAAGQLNVEEACSGMRLMMAFVTLGLAMSYLGDRPLWQRLVLVASCVPIAVFCNTIRVTLTGYFTITGHEDLAKGTPHQLLGIAMLLLALGLFAAIGYVLDRLFVEVDNSD